MAKGHDGLEFVSFQEGVERIEKALKTVGAPTSLSADGAPVVTSRDAVAKRMKETLKISGQPGEYEKWQLPVYGLGEGAQFFITVAQPGTKIDEHAHPNGAALRFVASGSIIYAGQELTQSDWMFIPKNTRYSFDVGPLGAVLCYCYCCCCVPRVA
jgi:hypothetical protein